MKITCQSCGAKYTIADDKVRGRTVKIRCKGCHTPILVKGNDIASPTSDSSYEQQQHGFATAPAADAVQAEQVQWMVALSDGSQPSGTVQMICDMFQNGQISQDTYVWRDGMANWQALSSTPELWDAIQQMSSEPIENQPAAAAQSAAFPSPSAGLFPQPQTAAMSAGLFGSGGQAARVDPQKQYEDLFGAAHDKAAQEQNNAEAYDHDYAKPMVPRFTAERNENSVLFTIDSILAAGKGSPKNRSQQQEEEKVDFGHLASLPPPASIDDLPSRLGQGALVAPTLPTTIEPDPIPAPAPSTLQNADPFMAPQEKSRRGVIYGLIVAVVVLLLVVVIGAITLLSKDEPVAMKTPDSTADELQAKLEKQKAEQQERDRKEQEELQRKKEEEKKAEAEKSDTKEDSTTASDPAAAAKNAIDSSDSSKSAAATKSTSRSGTAATGTKKTADASDSSAKKSADKQPTAAAPPEPAPSGGNRTFSRSAAISALSAAAGSAASCKKPDGPTGRGQVSVTFAPSGRVTTANVGGAFAGTSVGGCVANIFRRATVPPFDGSPVTVRKSFSIN